MVTVYVNQANRRTNCHLLKVGDKFCENGFIEVCSVISVNSKDLRYSGAPSVYAKVIGYQHKCEFMNHAQIGTIRQFAGEGPYAPKLMLVSSYWVPAKPWR